MPIDKKVVANAKITYVKVCVYVAAGVKNEKRKEKQKYISSSD